MSWLSCGHFVLVRISKNSPLKQLKGGSEATTPWLETGR
jgi:hypothetical protein